jgi:CheY-like chemotaxis protein
MKKRVANILLVDDSKSDQVIVQRALEDGRIACELAIAENGKEALSKLDEIRQSKEKMFPDIILMDINMPVMGGKQALEFIRNDDDLKHIPVIMLTTSNRDKDILESYELGVNAYLTKPVNHLDFVVAIQRLEQFWFELIALPPSRL